MPNTPRVRRGGHRAKVLKLLRELPGVTLVGARQVGVIAQLGLLSLAMSSCGPHASEDLGTEGRKVAKEGIVAVLSGSDKRADSAVDLLKTAGIRTFLGGNLGLTSVFVLERDRDEATRLLVAAGLRKP